MSVDILIGLVTLFFKLAVAVVEGAAMGLILAGVIAVFMYAFTYALLGIAWLRGVRPTAADYAESKARRATNVAEMMHWRAETKRLRALENNM